MHNLADAPEPLRLVPLSLGRPGAMPPRRRWGLALAALVACTAVACAAFARTATLPPPVQLPVDVLAHEAALLPPLPGGAIVELSGAGAEAVWPAAAALCRWLVRNRAQLRGAAVLELGAGEGAVGLVASALGASRVVLTDRPSEVARLQANAVANAHLHRGSGQSVHVLPLVWGRDAVRTLRLAAPKPWDLVLGSDVTFAHEHTRALAATLRELLDGSATTGRAMRIVLSHEHRSASRWALRDRQQWDEADGALASFASSAAAEGLSLRVLHEERPVSELRDGWRLWTADLSIFEVGRAAAANQAAH
jgi:predicted nicotinamide N-methyase